MAGLSSEVVSRSALKWKGRKKGLGPIVAPTQTRSSSRHEVDVSQGSGSGVERTSGGGSGSWQSVTPELVFFPLGMQPQKGEERSTFQSPTRGQDTEIGQPKEAQGLSCLCLFWFSE